MANLEEVNEINYYNLSVKGLEESLNLTTDNLRAEGGAAEHRPSIVSSEGDDVDADEEVEEIVRDNRSPLYRKIHRYLRWIKIFILFLCWLLFTSLLWKKPEVDVSKVLLYIPPNGIKDYYLPLEGGKEAIEVLLRGPFLRHSPTEPHSERNFEQKNQMLTLGIKHVDSDSNVNDISDVWHLELVDHTLIESTPMHKRMHIFDLYGTGRYIDGSLLLIRFITTSKIPIPLSMSVQTNAVSIKTAVICAATLLSGMYILLFLNIVNRTLTAILASTLAIGMLAYFHRRPTLHTIFEWIDVETMMLIFGMGIIVGIFSETGIHDYLALQAYKYSNGHIWPLINCTCLIIVISALAWDNITIVMLICPVVLRLSDIMQLNPVPFLQCIIIATNLAGAIAPHAESVAGFNTEKDFYEEKGITQMGFFTHLLMGLLLSMAISYIYLRIFYVNSSKMRFKESAEVERLRRVIKLMKHTAKGISGYTKDETAMKTVVMKKVHVLRHQLHRIGRMPEPPKNFEQTLEYYQSKYYIINRTLLIQCGCVMLFVLSLTLISRFVPIFYMSVGWITLLGAILILILSDKENLESILHRIEWSSIIFFAAFFVLTHAISLMGLFDAVQMWTEEAFINLDVQQRLSVGILVILWVSGLASVILNTVPVTLMMLKIIVNISDNVSIEVPIQPLVWALTLGCSLGSNGMLISNYANVIAAGMAEKRGYTFSFTAFFIVGFPVTLATLVIASAYLMVAHVAFSWHN